MAITRLSHTGGRFGRTSTTSDPRFHSSDNPAANPERYRPFSPDHPLPAVQQHQENGENQRAPGVAEDVDKTG
jgi:hypothetical protein